MKIMKIIKKTRFLLFLTLIITLPNSCCLFRDCEVNPDLTSKLLAPSSDIILGEPVDWDYTVSSVRDGAKDCNILQAAATVGEIVIDFFQHNARGQGVKVFERQNNIKPLNAGESDRATNRIDIFKNEGVYLISVEADKTNLVEERNENNNKDTSQVITNQTNMFIGASKEFNDKLSQSSAIVVIGKEIKNSKGKLVKSYNGKPIYYANKKYD